MPARRRDPISAEVERAIKHDPVLVAYEAWLEEVWTDPLAEVHAAALERGRRKKAERELRELEAQLRKPRTVRPGGRLRDVG